MSTAVAGVERSKTAERVLVTGRPSWWLVLPSAVIVVPFMTLVAILVPGPWAIAPIAVMILIYLPRVIYITTTTVTVTSERVRFSSGLLVRTRRELLLRKIETVEVEQSVFGRMCGYCTLVLVGSGGSPFKIDAISQGRTIERAIADAVESK